MLGDHAEAQDIVQEAWLRLHRTDAAIGNLPAWLTTVTTRLCLDRLRSRTPIPVDDVELGETVNDPADDVALADTVGLALHVVLDRLSPRERVAFVLHDSFGFEFPTIALVLDTTPAAARKMASRARAKVTQPRPEDALADWDVVDAFMAAAKGGDFERLLRLLAPDAAVTADDAAVLVGTLRQIVGRDEVATFFNGSPVRTDVAQADQPRVDDDAQAPSQPRGSDPRGSDTRAARIRPRVSRLRPPNWVATSRGTPVSRSSPGRGRPHPES